MELTVSCNLLQGLDPVAGIRMGGKQIVHPFAGQGIDDEHVGRRRIAFGGHHWSSTRDPGYSGKGGRQGKRVTGNLRAEAVGAVLSCPADSHLNQHGRDRGCQRGNQDTNESERIVVAAPAEEEREIGQHGDGAGERRCDRHDQRVAIADVGQFVGHDTGHFRFTELVQETGGRGHGGIFRVTPGGKGIGLRIVDQVDLGHRQSGPFGKMANHGVQPWRRRCVDFLRIVHAQNHLVGIPEREEIHRGGEDQGQDCAAGTADKVSHTHEKSRHCRQKHAGLHNVHVRAPFNRTTVNSRRSRPARRDLQNAFESPI